DLGLSTSEAPISLDEIIAGIKDGSVTDMLACGTAAVVIGVKALHFEDGSRIDMRGQTPGRVTQKLYESLVDIQDGRATEPHGWVTRVCRADQHAPAAR